MSRWVTPIRVIIQRGPSTLVQWLDDDMPMRGWVPSSKVKGDVIDTVEIRRAQPYGIPYEDIIELKATPREMAKNLRGAGIWTLEDLRGKPNPTLGAIMATYAVDYQILLKRANAQDGGKEQ